LLFLLWHADCVQNDTQPVNCIGDSDSFGKEIAMQYRRPYPLLLGAASLALLFGSSSIHAQTSSTDPSSGGTHSSAGAASSGAEKGSKGATISKADQNAMREMAYSNLAEIETAKIALKQSKNDQVQSFAQKMIDDHTQAQNDLKQLAQAKNVTLPTEPDSKHKEAAKKMRAMEGDKFDKAYLSQGGVTDHKETHRLLDQAQNKASDPDLKALIAKMKPVVEEHLSMAQSMHVKKGAASSGASGASGGSSAAGK
jgi:putative membrane protein